MALTIGPDGTITIGTGKTVNIDASDTHFTSGNGTTLVIETTSSDAQYGSSIQFAGPIGSGIGSYWVGSAGFGNNGQQGSFEIWDQRTDAQRLSIDKDGNVGINQLYPRAKLDVVGDGNSSEAMNVDGNASFSGLVNVDGGATFSESVNVDGDATFSGSVKANTIAVDGKTTTHTIRRGFSSPPYAEPLAAKCETGVVVGVAVGLIQPQGDSLEFELQITCSGS